MIRNDWYYSEDTTNTSKLLDSSLRQWILGMKPEEREKLTDAIFHILQSETNAHTIQDLIGGGAGTLSGAPCMDRHAAGNPPIYAKNADRTAALRRTDGSISATAGNAGRFSWKA